MTTKLRLGDGRCIKGVEGSKLVSKLREMIQIFDKSKICFKL